MSGDSRRWREIAGRCKRAPRGRGAHGASGRPVSPLYLPYISPISPYISLYLPRISQVRVARLAAQITSDTRGKELHIARAETVAVTRGVIALTRTEPVP